MTHTAIKTDQLITAINMATNSLDLVANPFSTGGGGTVFEVNIQASLLASLLVRAHAPGCPSSTISEVHLQTRYKGGKTDDALIVVRDSPTTTRKQLWSIKHEIKFTANDSVLREVIGYGWEDFMNEQVFDKEKDMIVLATGPLPSTYRPLITLLEIIRATSSYENFQAKLERDGFISKRAKEYLMLLTSLSKELLPKEPEPVLIWRFMKCLHIMSYDFDQTASKDEALIKTLLSLSVRAGTECTGDALWNRIFKWVSDTNPRGVSFTRDSLPNEWRLDTNSIERYFESGCVSRLLDHSKLNLRRVRYTIGTDLRLPRQQVVSKLANAFATEALTLVCGEAGVGKSAASIMALHNIATEDPVFVFQAKEFAHDHLDSALSAMRIVEPIGSISALFGMHRCKFIVLESVERLLESEKREAFTQLLCLLAGDTTWRVIMTCREHYAALVVETFLKPNRLEAFTAPVQKLSEQELDMVLESRQALKKLVKNAKARRLLTNPWFLDKACSIDWAAESTETVLDQRQLRQILWRQIVVRDSAQIGGMHLKRDRVFCEIALARARSMRSFVPPVSGDEEAIQALLADELLVADVATNAVAPAHDVLEDWALLRWVAAEFEAFGFMPHRFFVGIGNHLPIRRAFRNWLQERLTYDNLSEVRIFTNAVLSDSTLPNYWRDETVVSLLLSKDATDFVNEHEKELLKDGKAQLRIVTHLLRLVCKKPNPLWPQSEMKMAELLGDLHLVPAGSAWGAVIDMIQRNMQSFDVADLPYVLGLLEDWRNGCHWQNPLPPASREVGLIAIHFWNLLVDGYTWKNELKRVMQIILWTTHAVPLEFENLVTSILLMNDNQDCDRYHIEILSSKLLSSMNSGLAIRSHATLTASVARKVWSLGSPPSPRGTYGLDSSDMNSRFGLPLSLGDSSPSSALQGPFHILLHVDPQVAFGLIIDLVNITTDRYVKMGLDARHDAPVQIDLDTGGGIYAKQWVSTRLWLLYRGAMPGPDIVESALMALESYLLALASTNDVSDIVRDLIRRSTSVAITSVVASVAMSQPESVGDVVLTLLREPIILDLDVTRYVHDQGYLDMGDGLLDHLQKVHYSERLASSKLAHRRENLESISLRLQRGVLRDAIWKVFDRMKDDLGDVEKQSDHVKLFRLKLHRMDVRNFVPTRKLEDGSVMFSARPADADIMEVVQKRASMLQSSSESSELLAWGVSVFDNRDQDIYHPSRWQEMLTKAQLYNEQEPHSSDDFWTQRLGGAAYITAVCIRDHWDELEDSQKDWCKSFILSEINANRDRRDEMMRSQRNSHAGQVAAARVLPFLLCASKDDEDLSVRQAVAGALTHSVLEVREYVAFAIGENLWEKWPAFAEASVGLFIALSEVESRMRPIWEATDWQERILWEDFIAASVAELRERVSRVDDTITVLHETTGFESEMSLYNLGLLGSILRRQQGLPLAQKFFRAVAFQLIRRWDKKKGSRTGANDRNYHGESELRKHFAFFAIRCDPDVALNLWKPFCEVICDSSKEVAKVVLDLICAQDLCETSEAFWAMWNRAKDNILAIPDCNGILSKRDSSLAKLASLLLFDNVGWKANVRDWKALHGHKTEIYSFVKEVAIVPKLCRSYIRLLGGIGGSFLPDGLIVVAECIRKGGSANLIGNADELLSLASVLTPLVFGRSLAFRHDIPLRDAVLCILDAMVEQGSSSAYRMRDALIF